MTVPPGGMNAAELAAVVDELGAALRDAEIVDCARVVDCDDLLLFVAVDGRKRALHIAPGGPRARLCTTTRRFARDRFQTGPQLDRLRRVLNGGRLRDLEAVTGERRCTLALIGAGGESLALVVELFGPRGLWALLDADGVLIELSRTPTSKHRQFAIGRPYQPPAPAPSGGGSAAPVRFAAPVAEHADRHFTALDLAGARSERRARLQRAADRAARRAMQKVTGLERQAEQIADAPEVRMQADLLLAYGHGVARGQRELVAPHPDDADRSLRIELDPALPVHAQAETLYRRARKLEDARGIAAQRLDEARAEHADLARLSARCAAAADDDDDGLDRIEAELIRRSLLPKPPAKRDHAGSKARKEARGESFRRFSSAEGYPIMVGKSNEQNDRLSMRVARGNDLWLHVGQGFGGSHVVVRVPRGKTPSLETMLDAGTLAVHFSKARGTPKCEVIYTQAKHVKKPKGLPAGRVVPHHTKTLGLRLDPDRLRRLLDGAGEDA